MANKIKFVLNGCDISFIAEAPEDITLKQLLLQTDKIFPDYCACGICSMDRVMTTDFPVEVSIGYDNIKKIDKTAAFTIRENWRKN